MVTLDIDLVADVAGSTAKAVAQSSGLGTAAHGQFKQQARDVKAGQRREQRCEGWGHSSRR